MLRKFLILTTTIILLGSCVRTVYVKTPALTLPEKPPTVEVTGKELSSLPEDVKHRLKLLVTNNNKYILLLEAKILSTQ